MKKSRMVLSHLKNQGTPSGLTAKHTQIFGSSPKLGANKQTNK